MYFRFNQPSRKPGRPRLHPLGYKRSRKLPVKPGMFLSEARYLHELNCAIRKFQLEVATPFHHIITGENQTIYNAIRAFGQPITRSMLMAILYPNRDDFDDYTWAAKNRQMHSRLTLYLERGLLLPAGRLPHPTHPWFSSMSYVIAPDADLSTYQMARRRLYTRVDYLNCQRQRSAHLMLHAAPRNQRTSQMLAMRASGHSLQQIASHFHLTRERIRQILGRAYFPNSTLDTAD